MKNSKINNNSAEAGLLSNIVFKIIIVGDTG
jgi:hypothetical protein